MIAMLTVLVSTFALLVAQEGRFIDRLFEVASAFGAVGLSRGATAELDAFGRRPIAFPMFAGRVGPLTLGYFLAIRAATRVRYPSAQVYLG